MIPKIFHYCWFGKTPLPTTVQQCIDSWKRFHPDFEIKCWNEESFDISLYPFAKEAYDAKKYAFVADICRLHVLKHYGGIYLDTDMEFIRPLTFQMMNNLCFAGWENSEYVAAGIIGSQKNSKFIEDVLFYYSKEKFLLADGNINTTLTIPKVMTNVLLSNGLIRNGQTQEIPHYFTSYGISVFYPKDYRTGITEIMSDTVAIHHYDATWHSEEQRLRFYLMQHQNRFYQSVEVMKKVIGDEETNLFITTNIPTKIMLKRILERIKMKFL